MSEPVKEGFNWRRVASGALNFIDGVISQYGEDKRAQINRQFQSSEAEKNRQFQQQMYDRQLDDNIAWRTHQEEYNSPEAQMQRYRDAGINPMYAVTGHGQNTVQSPMSMTSGFGSSPSGGASTSPIDSTARRAFEMNRRVQENQMQNNTKIADAQAYKFTQEGELAKANAEGVRYENVGKKLDSLVNEVLLGTDIHGKNYTDYLAAARASAEEHKRIYEGLSFNDAKKQLIHSDVMRQFQEKLTEIERDKMNEELTQAKDATEISEITKNWARANNIINASAQVIGAIGAIVGMAKGTPMLPYESRSYSESFGDHTRRYEYSGSYDQNVYHHKSE